VRAVLVDTGPLVAILHRDDQAHDRAVEATKSIRDPLVTAWPVITEAMHLLGFSWRARAGLWDMIEEEAVKLLALDHGDAPRMRELMFKCRDVPMDLADAALVRVAEREGLSQIFTLDEDFAIYRLPHRGRFSVIRV
jgi:predicted nucleic acid-binding protein